MKDMTNKIRQIAATLFEKNQIDVFLAWRKGNVPHQTEPYVAANIEDVGNIVFDEYSIHNLSTSLLKYRDGKEKIGIVAKGCDSRGIVRLLEDNQIERDRLYIIGVCCPGMKDPLKSMKLNYSKNTQ